MSNEQQSTQKIAAPKLVVPAREQAITAPADDQAALMGVMRRLGDDGSRLRPADAALSQRTVGNRATGALLGKDADSAETIRNASTSSFEAITQRINQLGIQAKMTVGPVDDPHEKEADRMAKQVVQRIDRQEDDELEMKRTDGIQRQEEDELEMSRLNRTAAPPGDSMLDGGEVYDALESNIRSAKGSGSPLADAIRKPMEGAFNADFGSVKIHTDSQADALNRSVSANAFTTGNDIFFRSGTYSPGSSGGKELLAHELTHVVQQGGATARTATPNSISRTAVDSLQRMPSRRDMETIAGKPSKRAIKNHSTYIQILEALEAFKDAEDNARPGNLTTEIKRGLLDPIVNLSQNWLDNHKNSSRRGIFIQGLKSDAQAAKYNNITQLDTSPTSAAKELEESRETAEVPDFDREDGGVPDAYRFTVAAAVEHPDFLKYATARFKLKMSSPRKYKKMSGEEQRLSSARKVLFSKFKKKEGRPMTEEEQASEEFTKDVEKLSKAGVGHTWVKFVALKEGKVQQVNSFGFYPLVPVAKPTVAVPGVVMHPDTAHENQPDEDRRYKDTDIDQETYNKGIGKAVSVLNSPPDYTMWDYNCTRFARDMAMEVGAPFPGTYKTIPKLGKFLQAYSPNNTFDTMEADEDAYAESKELDDIREVEEEGQREEQEALRARRRVEGLMETNPHTLQTDLVINDMMDDSTYAAGTEIYVWGMAEMPMIGQVRIGELSDPTDYYAEPTALLAALGMELD